MRTLSRFVSAIAFIFVGALILTSVQAASVPEVGIRTLQAAGSSISFGNANVAVAGSASAVSYSVINDSDDRIFSLRTTAFVFARDGRPKGFQSQRARPGVGLLAARAQESFSLAIDTIKIENDDLIVLGVSEVTSAAGTWSIDQADLTRQARQAALGATGGQPPTGASVPGTIVPGTVAQPESGGGPAWCTEERDACKEMCGLRCIQEFTCQAVECYSHCECKTSC